MKKTAMAAAAALCLLASCQPKEETPPPASFTFSVEEDAGFNNLPALQSFAMGVDGDDWLMIGGRTNGFHGFGADEDFPFKLANYFIYAYDSKNHKLDSIPTSMLPAALVDQYSSTNMQVRQVDKYLYLCGGYGLANAGTPDSAWTTYNTLSRIDVKQMIAAVRSKDSSKLAASIAYTSNDIVRATGGELYQLPDGKWYLVLGHIFTGAYSSDTTVPSPIQQYLDSIHIFRLKETGNSIAFDGPFSYLSDGLPDSITQFRRRDLVVSPSVTPQGKDMGLAVYAGVFTWQTNPFPNPIYITGGDAPSYTIDSAFNQVDNIYSAPSIVMYDGAYDRVYTTVFGGLGNNAALQDNAAFTKLISTLCRDNKAGTTSISYNADSMIAFIGSEGAFIQNRDNPHYKDKKMEIVDYRKLKGGEKHLLGYIYGGIWSQTPQWGSSNPTVASNKVLKVYVTPAK
jgi:hypothetical protein